MWCTSIVARVITPTKQVNTHACEYRMSMTQEQQQQRCFNLKFPYKKVRKSAKTASHASTEPSRRHVRENELSPCLCLRSSPCVRGETTTLKVVELCREPLNQTTNLGVPDHYRRLTLQGRHSCVSKYPSRNFIYIGGSAFDKPHLLGLVLFLHGGAQLHVVVGDSVHSRVSIRRFQGVLGVQAWIDTWINH